MFRNSAIAAAAFAGAMLAADTGANPAAANAAAPVETPNAAATPAAAGDAATPARAKRGRAAAGLSLFPVADIDAGKTLAKEKGDKFTVFKVVIPGKDDTYFVSNHRNAVQHRVLADLKVEIGAAMGGGGRKANPEKVAATAETYIAGLDDEARKALFAKFMAGGAVDLAANMPAQPARQDSTPAAEFDAPTGKTPNMTTGVVATPPAAASGKAAPAGKATPPAKGKGK